MPTLLTVTSPYRAPRVLRDAGSLAHNIRVEDPFQHPGCARTAAEVARELATVEHGRLLARIRRWVATHSPGDDAIVTERGVEWYDGYERHCVSTFEEARDALGY